MLVLRPPRGEVTVHARTVTSSRGGHSSGSSLDCGVFSGRSQFEHELWPPLGSSLNCDLLSRRSQFEPEL